MTTLRLPTYEDVAAAAARIAGHAHRTPVLTLAHVDAELGAERLLQVREPPARRRVQVPRRLQRAVALRRAPAARRRRRLLVGQPRAGHRARGEAARHAGDDRHAARRARRQGGRDEGLRRRGRRSTTATARTARRSARASPQERGMTLIPPYDHPDVIAGQGTAAMELIEEVGAARRALRLPRRRRPAPGSVLAARALAPACKFTASSPRPATTASSRFAAATSCASRRRGRSPTAPRRSISASTPFRSSAGTSPTSSPRPTPSSSRRCASSPSA